MSGRLGFLGVTSQLSSHIPIAEFHEWYEDEHIPLRLNHLQGFLAGARFRSHSRQTQNRIDADGPLWLALYVVDSLSVFSDPDYTSLRTNRSERELSVLSRIEVLTRLTGEVLDVWVGNKETTGFQPGQPSGSIITHGLSIRGDVDAMVEIGLWMRCIQQGVASSQELKDGWVRTHLVCISESGISHFGVNVKVEAEKDEQRTMPYFVVHG